MSIEFDLETADFDLAMARARDRLLESNRAREIRGPFCVTPLRYAPFVEMGTLRPPLSVPAGTRMLRMAHLAADREKAATLDLAGTFTSVAREAQRGAVVFERLRQIGLELSEAMRKADMRMWRVERPYALLKWGAVLTLIVAGVAILCQ